MDSKHLERVRQESQTVQTDIDVALYPEHA